MTTPTGIGKHRGEDPPAPKHWMPLGEYTATFFLLGLFSVLFLLIGVVYEFPWEGP